MRWLLCAVSCTSSGPADPRVEPPPADEIDPFTADTAPPDTGAGPTPTGPDCASVPEAPLSVTTHAIETTEDFDFDADGWLVYAANGALVGVDQDGQQKLVAVGVGAYLRGIQVLASEDLVVADFNMGRLLLVHRQTGGLTTITAAMTQPNGLEVGDDDVVYVSDPNGGRSSVRAMTTDGTPLGDVPLGSLASPNGLALDPTGDRLYIGAETQGVWVSRRQADGRWGAAELAFDPGGFSAAVEVDACGNVYTVDYYSGRLYRFDPDLQQTTLLVDLDDPDGWLWNSLRWGSDRGGWRRDVLYVTNRHQLFGVELGVRGRGQPVDDSP